MKMIITTVFRFSFPLCLLVLFISCRKNAKTNETNTSLRQLSFGITDWYAYPYMGGPDEDSMFLTRIVLPENIGHSEIRKVYYKTVTGNPTIPKYTGSAESGRISYQIDPDRYNPLEILFWWQQTAPSVQPSIDSVFLEVEY